MLQIDKKKAGITLKCPTCTNANMKNRDYLDILDISVMTKHVEVLRGSRIALVCTFCDSESMRSRDRIFYEEQERKNAEIEEIRAYHENIMDNTLLGRKYSLQLDEWELMTILKGLEVANDQFFIGHPNDLGRLLDKIKNS